MSLSQNPYFATEYFRNEDVKHRIIASNSLRYDVTDWLYASGRIGIDHTIRKGVSVTPFGTAFQPLGSMTEDQRTYSQVDADVILGIDKDVTEKLSVSALIGANSNHIKYERLVVGGGKFIIPGFEDISNLTDQTRSREFNQRKIGSVYGSVDLSYNDWAFLTLTGRNDWFSTLSFPGKTTPNDVFYPSVSTSLILSDAFELPDAINYLKLRAGYSKVGGGGDVAYQLVPNDEFFGQGHPDRSGVSQPLGRISGSTVPNFNLVPWTKTEIELGFDTRLFNNRLSIDFALYQNKTVDDLVKATVSVYTGYSDQSINLGELKNKGVELLISGTPVKKENFSWNTSINGAFNESLIVETNPAGQPVSLDEPRSRNVRIQHQVGQRYGKIVGVGYARDDAGNIIYEIDADGVPLAKRGDRIILGDGVPPLTLGWSNSLRFGDFNFNFLIDGKFGGQVFSGTNTVAYGLGLHKATLEGRENGLSVSGVDESGTPFTTTVAPENLSTYYDRIKDIAEEFVEDSDFIKFRELSLGYNLPRKFLDNSFLTDVNISVVARNLFYFKRSVDNIDPESAYSVGNSQGLEYFGVPSTKSYGFTLNVKF